MAMKFYPQVDRRIVQYRLDQSVQAGVTLEKGNELYTVELAAIDAMGQIAGKVLLNHQQAVTAYEFLRQLLRGQERNVIAYTVREDDMGREPGVVEADHMHDYDEDDEDDGILDRGQPTREEEEYAQQVERRREDDDATCPHCGQRDCQNFTCAFLTKMGAENAAVEREADKAHRIQQAIERAAARRRKQNGR